jgi:hypothetical protein
MGGCFTKQRVNPNTNIIPVTLNRDIPVNDITEVERIIENYMNPTINGIPNNLDRMIKKKEKKKEKKEEKKKKKKEEIKEKKMCRICFEENGRIYNYCNCNGSIKYIHEKCLIKWIKYSKSHRCEICKQTYKKNHKYSKKKKMKRLLRRRDNTIFNTNRYVYNTNTLYNRSRTVTVT